MRMTYTQNNALTYETTGNPVLDLFGRVGGMRGQTMNALHDFEKAYLNDPALTRKLLFWLRDVRQGQGERELFRSFLHYTCLIDPHYVNLNAHLIPEYGRWDDLLVLLQYRDTRPTAVEIIRKQLDQDLSSKDGRVSLCAKWLPSQNASSKNTRELASILQKALGFTPRNYRKMLTLLRKDIGILETRLTKRQYANLQYDRIPSQAMKIHGRKGKAFLRNDATRFTEYIVSVNNGSKSIKAATLYPYELVREYIDQRYFYQADPVIEAQWNALPDMPDHNGIVVCDVSGSMNNGAKVTPMQVALSLAIYMAERNSGRFHNHFITFSEKPQVQALVGRTLKEKIQNLCKADWDMNTNIQAVFEALLRWPGDQSDMPDAVYIVSDMEFDQCTGNNSQTNLEVARSKFERAGIKMPLIVFWNVNGKNSQTPATKHSNGVVLVSGSSPNTIRGLLQGDTATLLNMTPEKAMYEVLNGERYAAVK